MRKFFLKLAVLPRSNSDAASSYYGRISVIARPFERFWMFDCAVENYFANVNEFWEGISLAVFLAFYAEASAYTNPETKSLAIEVILNRYRKTLVSEPNGGSLEDRIAELLEFSVPELVEEFEKMYLSSAEFRTALETHLRDMRKGGISDANR